MLVLRLLYSETAEHNVNIQFGSVQKVRKVRPNEIEFFSILVSDIKILNHRPVLEIFQKTIDTIVVVYSFNIIKVSSAPLK